MKSKILAILVASFAVAAVPLTATAGQGNGKGGNSPGASGEAPGHNKGDSGQASGGAPGKSKSGSVANARQYAPGQMKKAGDDDDLTDSIGKTNFGAVISSIRAGKGGLAGVGSDTVVNVVDVNDLLRGNNRAALENALSDRSDAIDDLRDELAELGLSGLTADEIDDAVAARRAKDGSLTVFIYDD